MQKRTPAKLPEENMSDINNSKLDFTKSPPPPKKPTHIKYIKWKEPFKEKVHFNRWKSVGTV